LNEAPAPVGGGLARFSQAATVIREIETVAGDCTDVQLTEAAARDIKPMLSVDVSRPCDTPAMTDDEILAAALADGFELEERVCQDRWVHGWHRGDDDRWPCYRTRGEALRWMADRLRRQGVFR
jgi:hypothetical protein